MGLLQPTDWTARWIQQRDPAPENATKAEQVQSIYPLPIFRKPFEIQSDVKSAKVYVCGLGHYELFVNGQKAGEHFLDPAWSLYEKTVYYNTFDITDFLRVGSNVFGVMLGKGFYNTRGDRRIHFVNIYRPLKLILQADIEYKDGSRQVVASDGSWKFTRGPLTHCAILGGSDYDARLLPADWRLPGYDEADWKQAEETAGPGGMLTAFTAAPMKRIAVLNRFRLKNPKPDILSMTSVKMPLLPPALPLKDKPAKKFVSPHRNSGTARPAWPMTAKAGSIPPGSAVRTIGNIPCGEAAGNHGRLSLPTAGFNISKRQEPSRKDSPIRRICRSSGNWTPSRCGTPRPKQGHSNVQTPSLIRSMN